MLLRSSSSCVYTEFQTPNEGIHLNVKLLINQFKRRKSVLIQSDSLLFYASVEWRVSSLAIFFNCRLGDQVHVFACFICYNYLYYHFIGIVTIPAARFKITLKHTEVVLLLPAIVKLRIGTYLYAKMIIENSLRIRVCECAL